MTQAESKLSGRIIDDLLKQGIFAFKVHGSAYMVAGLPDIIACVDGHFVGLETKMPAKRNNVSEIQKLRHAQIQHAGGIAEVVCGPKEALAIIDRVRAKLDEPADQKERQRMISAIQDLRSHRMGDLTPTRDTLIQGRREGEANAFDLVIDLLEGRL